MLADGDEEIVTIIQHMDDLFGKRDEEAIFGDAGDLISGQQFLSLLFVIVLMDDGLVGFEDDGECLADGDGDGDGGDELDLGAGLDCHFYLLEDHQQLDYNALLECQLIQLGITGYRKWKEKRNIWVGQKRKDK